MSTHPTQSRTFELGDRSWIAGLGRSPVPPSHLPDSPARRSMVSNRDSDTAPEVALRLALHHLGLRYRKNHKVVVPGATVRIDIAFPRHRVGVFVDGCFWHSCPEHGRTPNSNSVYWTEKLDRNIRRDRLANERLVDAGWMVIRVWAHAVVPARLPCTVDSIVGLIASTEPGLRSL
jgi:DNA mismatch endonuclease (patch repair protein)